MRARCLKADSQISQRYVNTGEIELGSNVRVWGFVRRDPKKIWDFHQLMIQTLWEFAKWNCARANVLSMSTRSLTVSANNFPTHVPATSSRVNRSTDWTGKNERTIRCEQKTHTALWSINLNVIAIESSSLLSRAFIVGPWEEDALLSGFKRHDPFPYEKLLIIMIIILVC